MTKSGNHVAYFLRVSDDIVIVMSEYTYPQVAFNGNDEVEIQPTPKYDVMTPLNAASTPTHSSTTPLNNAATSERAESRRTRRCNEDGGGGGGGGAQWAVTRKVSMCLKMSCYVEKNIFPVFFKR